MKGIRFSLFAGGAVLFSLTVQPLPAQEAGAEPAGGGLADLIREARQRMMKQYDADNDGKLSPEEWEKAGSNMRQEFQKAVESQYDKDGDGQLSEEERASMQKEWEDQSQAWRQRIEDRMKQAEEKRLLSKYDEDKDGILSDSEKAKMEADKKAEAERLAAVKAGILAEYDTDKNGKLSPEEAAAMQEKVNKNLEHLRNIVAASKALAQEGDLVLQKVEQSIVRSRFSDEGRQWQDWSRQMQQRFQRGGGERSNPENN